MAVESKEISSSKYDQWLIAYLHNILYISDINMSFFWDKHTLCYLAIT